MNINNNQWSIIVLVTAALMLVFLIFVFYDNKRMAQMPQGTPNVEINVPPTQANPPATPAAPAP